MVCANDVSAFVGLVILIDYRYVKNSANDSRKERIYYAIGTSARSLWLFLYVLFLSSGVLLPLLTARWPLIVFRHISLLSS